MIRFDVAGKLYSDFELHELALDLHDRVRELEAANAELQRQLEQARAELHFFHSAFPQATKQYRALGEWEAETPFGQMLDGLGDEVES